MEIPESEIIIEEIFEWMRTQEWIFSSGRVIAHKTIKAGQVVPAWPINAYAKTFGNYDGNLSAARINLGIINDAAFDYFETSAMGRVDSRWYVSKLREKILEACNLRENERRITRSNY